MATSDDFSTLTVALFCAFYATVFILSTIGNTWVLATCYKTLKRRYFPFMWLLANLATADLSFTFLTVFNSVGFLWQWVGGNSTCKLQGFLLEASYTTSIITLVIVSHQRLRALTDPFNARIRSWQNREYIKLVVIWGLSLFVCSPLVYIYRVKTEEDGDVVCLTTTRGNIVLQIFYSLHTTFFFVIPLLYMIFTQSRIFRTLRTIIVPIENTFIAKSNQRQRRFAKTLAALTIAFVFCWSPFMVTRTLIYFHMASPGFVWRVSQFLIFLNTVLDPLLYGFFGGNLKSSLRTVFLCYDRRVVRAR
ncbi:galanin receptor 2b-like [Oculina patagonica]